MSKAEIRFERLQQAREALSQAEGHLTKHMEAERKANEELEEDLMELKRLGDELMAKVSIISLLLIVKL